MNSEENKTKTEEMEIEFIDALPLDEEDFDEIDVDQLIPQMNVSTNDIISESDKENIVDDNTLLGLYDEILNNCREDRNKVDEVLSNFLEMVINEGDASSASKEAVVNLIKIKSDTADKMSKIADLMTRVKLKEKDTFPRYLAAQQNNKVVIEGGGSHRELLKSISKLTNKKGKTNDSQA